MHSSTFNTNVAFYEHCSTTSTLLLTRCCPDAVFLLPRSTDFLMDTSCRISLFERVSKHSTTQPLVCLTFVKAVVVKAICNTLLQFLTWWVRPISATQDYVYFPDCSLIFTLFYGEILDILLLSPLKSIQMEHFEKENWVCGWTNRAYRYATCIEGLQLDNALFKRLTRRKHVKVCFIARISEHGMLILASWTLVGWYIQ